MTCQTAEEYVEPRIGRVLTQYRESEKLLGLARAFIQQAHDIHAAACDMPERFDMATCTGDQLTIVSKRLGLQRCHCVCSVVPEWGYPCETPDPNRIIVSYGAGVGYGGCNEAGTSDVCINDDEVFRAFLYARAFQLLRLYDIEYLTTAARLIWGDTAQVLDMGEGKVCIMPCRPLTGVEHTLLPVAFRVLPIAPGIQPHVDLKGAQSFNYGSGWGSYCDSFGYPCPEPIDPYACA